MKPIMNPPPMITVGIENIITTVPQALLFIGWLRNFSPPSKTKEPQINPKAVRLTKGTASLVAPGIVGITQGNQVETTPRNIALITIRIPAIKGNLKVVSAL